MNKDTLRKVISDKRDKMKSEDIKQKSHIITRRFLEEFCDVSTFLLYVSFKNEVETFYLIQHLSEKGKKIFLPKLKNEDIFPSQFEGFEKMQQNRYGIMEPAKLSNITSFDVAVIPAVAFDKKCNRLGFGKGYYDKLLAKINFDVCVGFAYELQVFDSIEIEPHDIPADVVITEENFYRRN